AGDPGGGGGLERAGRDQVDAHAVLADVFGEVAGGGFEGGHGHAHPVVDGPGDRRVEGQSHDSGALVEHGLGGHGDRLERVRGDVDRTGAGLPRDVEEDASEGVLRGECDRVDDAVDVALETFGQGREIVFVRGVEFDDLRGDRQALGDHL